MSRTTSVNFELGYFIHFSCAIRGHHIYKTRWTPTTNEQLFCEKDDREEAAEYDSHAVGVFKTDETLVGHIPIELSRLIDYFLKSSTENNVSAMVTGKRKRELGLVVPAKYTAFTKDKRLATVLQDELQKKNTRYGHFEMDFSHENLVKMPRII